MIVFQLAGVAGVSLFRTAMYELPGHIRTVSIAYDESCAFDWCLVECLLP